jgi:hypothetical protein
MSYLLVFKKTGVNAYTAATGTLTLFEDGAALITSPVFSGGVGPEGMSKPIPNETYHINLGIRGVATGTKELVPIPGTNFYQLHHWYGIEKIDLPEAQVEWGHYRAALNEPRKDMPQGYRGNFLHGKLRPNDYTHGCICERSEKILEKLWRLPPQTIQVKVEG